MDAARGVRRTATVLGLCAAQLAATGSGAVVHGAGLQVVSRHAAPKTLTLTTSDVDEATGEKFISAGVVVTNVEVATVERVSVATMNHYRVTGYQTTFARAASSGVTLVQDSVGLYRSAAAAHWQYKLFTGENKPPAGSKTISMKGIGDEARGYTIGAVSASVYFRRGVYTARIDILGLGVSLGPIVVRLSKVLDRRMRSH